MEQKPESALDFDFEKVRSDHEDFLKEIGIYFFILRTERGLKPTPVEKFLGITPGVIRQIEDDKLNWNTDMLDEIWNYYYSKPVRLDLLSRLNPKNKNSVLADLIKMGLKRCKFKNPEI